MATESDKNPPPTSARIGSSLPCRGCKYVLKGLAVTAQCPECRLPVTETLASTIDLESLQDRPLPHPRRAAISAIGIALAAILLPAAFMGGVVVNASPDLVYTAGSNQLLGWISNIGLSGAILGTISVLLLVSSVSRDQFQPAWLTTLALAGFLAGIVAVFYLPSLGFAMTRPNWSTSNLSTRLHPAMALQLIPVMFLAISVQMLLNSIGRRSLRFRRAGVGLQGAAPLAVTVLVQMILLFVALATRRSTGTWETVNEIARIGVVAAGGLGLVGFIYLFFNAIWAVGPLFRRHHRLEQLLAMDPTESDEEPPGSA